MSEENRQPQIGCCRPCTKHDPHRYVIFDFFSRALDELKKNFHILIYLMNFFSQRHRRGALDLVHPAGITVPGQLPDATLFLDTSTTTTFDFLAGDLNPLDPRAPSVHYRDPLPQRVPVYSHSPMYPANSVAPGSTDPAARLPVDALVGSAAAPVSTIHAAARFPVDAPVVSDVSRCTGVGDHLYLSKKVKAAVILCYVKFLVIKVCPVIIVSPLVLPFSNSPFNLVTSPPRIFCTN